MSNKVTIEEVKDYWEENIPQYWYSNKEENTKEYYDEIQKQRYSKFYPYLIKLAEFNEHPNEKVLEVGCGQGTDLLQFVKGGAKVWGVDLTEPAIKKTREMFKVYNYKVRLKHLDAEDLNIFGDNFFDVVYSFGVIHHTPNPQKMIDEIHRVLKPNGKAIIMIYGKGLGWWCRLFLFIFTGKFLKYSFQEFINIHSEYKGNCPLVRIYSVRQAQKLFKDFSKAQIKKLLPYNINNNRARPLYKKIAIGFIKRIPFRKYIFKEYIFGDNLFIKCIK